MLRCCRDKDNCVLSKVYNSTLLFLLNLSPSIKLKGSICLEIILLSDKVSGNYIL